MTVGYAEPSFKVAICDAVAYEECFSHCQTCRTKQEKGPGYSKRVATIVQICQPEAMMLFSERLTTKQ